MQTKICLFLLLLGSLFWQSGPKAQASPGQDSDFYVVVNPDYPDSLLDKVVLANIYLGKQTLWNSGNRIQPAMIKETAPSMKKFIENVLGKTVPQYRAYWKRRLFSGGGTVPRTFKNTENLLDYVARTPGAIGVCSQAVKMDGVKYIAISKGELFR